MNNLYLKPICSEGKSHQVWWTDSSWQRLVGTRGIIRISCAILNCEKGGIQMFFLYGLRPNKWRASRKQGGKGRPGAVCRMCAFLTNEGCSYSILNAVQSFFKKVIPQSDAGFYFFILFLVSCSAPWLGLDFSLITAWKCFLFWTTSSPQVLWNSWRWNKLLSLVELLPWVGSRQLNTFFKIPILGRKDWLID